MCKKTIALLLAAVMTVSVFFSGCDFSEMMGEQSSSSKANKSSSTSETDEPESKATTISPLLWKATSDKGGTVYLFGTIHVGDERSDSAIGKIKSKLEESDSLAVEYDVVSYKNNTEAQMKDIQMFVCPDNKKITDYVPEDLYNSMKSLCEDAGTYSTMFDNFNTGFWTQIITNALMAKCNLKSEKGIDVNLINLANDKNKSIIELENPTLQYNLMNSFSDELNILKIKSSLNTANTFNSYLNDMYENWLSGDESKLLDIINEEYSPDDGEYTAHEIELIKDYQTKMINDRNIAMAQKAKAMLDEGKKVFLAVGTAHIIGETGLVKQLTDAGYKVEKINL